jgi:hypothetical protein
MNLLESKYNIKFVKTTEDFDGSRNGIWIAGDNGEVLSGNKIFDYYNRSAKYTRGVLNTFRNAIEKLGWRFEWNDPATMMLYKNSDYEQGGSLKKKELTKGDRVIWKGNLYVLSNVENNMKGGFYDNKYYLTSYKVGVSDAILDSLKDVELYAKGGSIKNKIDTKNLKIDSDLDKELELKKINFFHKFIDFNEVDGVINSYDIDIYFKLNGVEILSIYGEYDENSETMESVIQLFETLEDVTVNYSPKNSMGGFSFEDFKKIISSALKKLTIYRSIVSIDGYEEYAEESDSLKKAKQKLSEIKNKTKFQVLKGESVGVGKRVDNTKVLEEYAKGGEVRFVSNSEDKLSRPSLDIIDLMKKNQNELDSDLFVGNFGWKTSSNKLADGYLYKLDNFDKEIVKDFKLKPEETIYRFVNRTSAIAGMIPLIKINTEKGLLYFAKYNDSDEIIGFETKGIKASWVSFLSDKFAKGGTTDEEYIDYFEDSNLAPPEVQKILNKHSKSLIDGDYIGLEKAKNELEKIGYTFEYYLDGIPYDLRPIGTKGKSEMYE